VPYLEDRGLNGRVSQESTCADISNTTLLFVSVGKPEITLYGSFFVEWF
jgi:hypothetical protein